MAVDRFISPGYLREQVRLHAEGNYGVSGARHAPAVEAIARLCKYRTVLDYGCGQGHLRAKCTIPIIEYDPVIKGKNSLPRPAELVVCVDVLEHVEPNCIRNVLAHLHSLTRARLFVAIALRESTKVLSDGHNAHILLLSPKKWRMLFAETGFAEIFWQISKGEMIGCMEKKRYG